MKLKIKEHNVLRGGFFLSLLACCEILELLNKTKENLKDDIIIFGVIFLYLYAITAAVLLFYCIDSSPTAIDRHILWVVFILITSLCAITVQAIEERLETYHYLGCGLVQLYILYLYESFFFGFKDLYGRSYLKRISVRVKRLGRERP